MKNKTTNIPLSVRITMETLEKAAKVLIKNKVPLIDGEYYLVKLSDDWMLRYYVSGPYVVAE